MVNHYFADKARPRSYMPRLAYALACMALGSLICVFAENAWVALFGVWTMAGARGAFLPAVQATQHEEFPERVRTTGLSVVNFSTEVMVALGYFVSASIVDSISVSSAWTVSVICFSLAALLSLAAVRGGKVTSATGTRK